MENVAVSIPYWKEASFQGSEGKMKFKSLSETIWFGFVVWSCFWFFFGFIMTGASNNSYQPFLIYRYAPSLTRFTVLSVNRCPSCIYPQRQSKIYLTWEDVGLDGFFCTYVSDIEKGFPLSVLASKTFLL